MIDTNINRIYLHDIADKDMTLAEELISAITAFILIDKDITSLKEQMNFLVMGICIFLSFIIWANLTGTCLYLGLSGSILWTIMLIIDFVEFNVKKRANIELSHHIDELIRKFHVKYIKEESLERKD